MINPNNVEVYSISQLNDLLNEHLNVFKFTNFLVEGEIVNFKKSGRILYITLCDAGNSTEPTKRDEILVLTYYNVDKLQSTLKNGDKVRVTCTISYYRHRSQISLYASKIEVVDNISLKLLEKMKLIKRLKEEGYYDPSIKRKIPEYVTNLGIISSSTAAGYKDILSTLSKRMRCNVYLFDSFMQGKNAVDSILSAFKKAANYPLDVIILSRGGGASTDLEIFDNYDLALAIRNSKCPVISAIGHSIDESVIDSVSDCYCITPTDAANKINESIEDFEESIETLEYGLNQAIEDIKYIKTTQFKNLTLELSHNSPKALLESKINFYENNLNSSFKTILLEARNSIETKTKITTYFKNNLDKSFLKYESSSKLFKNMVTTSIEKKKSNLISYEELLLSMNPDNPLKKGYVYIIKDNDIIKDISTLKEGDDVQIKGDKDVKFARIK